MLGKELEEEVSGGNWTSLLVVDTAPLPDYRENQPIRVAVRHLVHRQAAWEYLSEHLPTESLSTDQRSLPASQPDRPTDRQTESQITELPQATVTARYKSQVFIPKVRF